MERLAYKVPEGATLLNISTRLLWRLIHDGEIKTIRLGRCVRVPAEEIDRILSTAAAGEGHSRWRLAVGLTPAVEAAQEQLEVRRR